MNTEFSIRPAVPEDLAGVLAIYNHYVENTAITFDLEVQTEAMRRPWFDKFKPQGPHRFLVAERDGKVIGYAYSGTFRERAAYDRTVETAVYLAPKMERQGIGRALYTRLFEALAAEDIHRVIAGATWPNEGSKALHEAFGFTEVGLYTECGWKFDRYWDVMFWEKKM